MIYAKSESGLQAVKDRHAVDLTRAQRSVLILIDGKRSVREVLEYAVGATPEGDWTFAVREAGGR